MAETEKLYNRLKAGDRAGVDPDLLLFWDTMIANNPTLKFDELPPEAFQL